MAINKEISAGDLIRAISKIHNDLMLDWQSTQDPVTYALTKMLDRLIDNIELEVADNEEMH